VLTSSKQIVTEAKKLLTDFLNNEGNDDAKSLYLWTFKELLSWKIPEHLSSTSNQNLTRNRIEAEYLPPPINLYKYNLVT